MLDVKTSRAFCCCRAAVHALSARAAATSSMWWTWRRREGRGRLVDYCASKAALAMLTPLPGGSSWAPAVRVNGVAPGTVLFPEAYEPQERERRLSRVPLGRAGRRRTWWTPSSTARRARYVTGQILAVDGGRTA
jgi:pteridine reductase